MCTAPRFRRRFRSRIGSTEAHGRDALGAGGFDAWGLDFYGFGHSDRYPEMDQPAGDHPPLCVAEDAARQLEAAIRFILGHQNIAYDPAQVRSPVAIIRGAWDGLILDDDAHWLFEAFTQAPAKRDIKIGRGTHLMHLEAMRPALWRESISCLLGGDVAPVPA
jgi:pimeloyl-ACP methyl ester carboxylesterase